MDNHTPLPWKLSGASIWIHGADNSDVADVHGRTLEDIKANAAFIVRAVNSHEAVLDALKNVSAFFKLNPQCLADSDQRIVEKQINQAIAKAEGK